MRISSLVVSIALSGSVSAAPLCLYDSDSDGDGWGWENGQSCRVGVLVNGCDYSQEYSHGGWGYNPNTGELNCPPIISDNVNVPLSPFFEVFKGSWNCSVRYVHTAVPNGDLRVNKYAEITDWSPQLQCIQGRGKGCTALPRIKDLTFTQGSVTVKNILNDYWTGTTIEAWNVNDTFQLTIGDTLYQSFGFESYNRNKYLHLYYNDSTRLTCRKL